MVGKEMNQRTQAPAEWAVRDTLAAEAAGKAVSPPVNRMVRLLMHDWPTLLACARCGQSRHVRSPRVGKKTQTVRGTPKVVNAFNRLRRNRDCLHVEQEPYAILGPSGWRILHSRAQRHRDPIWAAPFHRMGQVEMRALLRRSRRVAPPRASA